MIGYQKANRKQGRNNSTQAIGLRVDQKESSGQSFLEVVLSHLAPWGERRDQETMSKERRGERRGW